MPLRFEDMFSEIRVYMLAEINSDEAAGRLYISENLNSDGAKNYPVFLKTAAESGSDETLARTLTHNSCFNFHERPRINNKTGVIIQPKMRSNAAQMLAEGEFNRFYLRGLCLYAIEKAYSGLEVYRARVSSTPRPGSEQLIGSFQEPASVLSDLRKNIGLETILGIPGGPNSGISLRLPK